MEKNKTNSHALNVVDLGDYCKGFSEMKDNCWNFSIISINKEHSANYNDYLAGYVQGKLQGKEMIKASRDNGWKNTFLCQEEPIFPSQLPPTKHHMQIAHQCLVENYRYLLQWINNEDEDKSVKKNILRLLYRMLGIYDGVTLENYMTEDDLVKRSLVSNLLYDPLGYGDDALSLMDIYFINAQLDMLDVISESLELTNPPEDKKVDRCTAFVKRTEDDIYWTHNSWSGFLSQSHTITYLVRNDNNDAIEKNNMDFVTQNAYCPGQFGSNMDFGFNGHGICFNETTHRCSADTHSTNKGIWLCWRAAAAEMFASNIDEFYKYISIDNTATYLNGYMLIDVKGEMETALIEMSQDRFILLRMKDSDTEYDITEYANGEERKFERNKDQYNPDLLCKEYIFGINYPITYSVSKDLKSTDNRPKRRIQLKERINTVTGIESAKELITYMEKDEPLSIYGRWDLGYGNAGGYSKTIPDGAVDAKAFSAKAVKELLENLNFTINENSSKTSFWMLYGTPVYDGKSFSWSDSKWKNYKSDNDFVPNELVGAWNRTKLFID